jgi:hypothetical protein
LRVAAPSPDLISLETSLRRISLPVNTGQLMTKTNGKFFSSLSSAAANSKAKEDSYG